MKWEDEIKDKEYEMKREDGRVYGEENRLVEYECMGTDFMCCRFM